MGQNYSKNCAGCGKTLIKEDGYVVEDAHGDKDLNLDGKSRLWCEKCYEYRKREIDSADDTTLAFRPLYPLMEG